MNTRSFKELRDTASKISSKKENSFQVDLRVHGVSQDVIYKNEGRMWMRKSEGYDSVCTHSGSGNPSCSGTGTVPGGLGAFSALTKLA